MRDRINDKIDEIEEFFDFLSERIPESLEEYKNNLEKKAVCERYIEKIIEAVVDLAFIFFKEEIAKKDKKVRMPESDTEIFEILHKRNIISEPLCKKLKEAKGMRNWIAHEYGKIDDEVVYNSIKNELEKDINEFLDNIKKTMRHLALKGEVCDRRSSFGCSRNYRTLKGAVFVKFLDIKNLLEEIK